MKNIKKAIALVLSLVSVLSLFTFSASAATVSSSLGDEAEDSGDYAYWSGSKVVKSGSTSKNEIKWMQNALNYCIANRGLKATKLTVDGSFGPASKAATLAFQNAYGLSADGKFGPATIKKMKDVLNKGTKSTYELYWPVAKSSHKIGGIGANSDFGPRNTGIAGASKDHKGIDLAVGKGTAVYAVAKGVITDIGENDIRGKYVVIYHSDLNISTLYQHLSNNSYFKKGANVSAGALIAKTGNTGIGGYHLHFGIMTGKATNPNHDQHGYAFDPLGAKVTYIYYK